MMLDAERVRALGAMVSVMDQHTGLSVPLLLNDEQLDTLEAICGSKRVICLKGRQIGLSTLCCLVDVAWALSNPGHTIGIVADVQLKAEGLLSKCASWLQQLSKTFGVKLLFTENVRTLELANGSRIIARSSSGKDSLRSVSLNLLHASEMGFFDDEAFGVMTSAMNIEAAIVIESSASPRDNDFSRIWHDSDNGYVHLFHNMEDHCEYRSPPTSISDERWAYLQGKFHFTRRDSAAWWSQKLAGDFVGDEFRMGQEYPVHSAMAFAFATGTWIHSWTRAATTTNGWTKERPRPEGNLTIYPQDGFDEPSVLSVDTSSGSGGDFSFLARIGRESGLVHRTWHSNRHNVAEFADVIVAEHARVPCERAIIEVNGVGYGVSAPVGRAGVPVREHTSEADEKELRYAYLRRDIESGALPIGPEIELECRQSTKRQDPNKLRVVYEGRDDGLSALSIGREWVRKNPWIRPVAPPDPTIVVVNSAFDRRKTIKF